MQRETIEKIRDFLVEQKYPDSLIPVRCASLAQLPPRLGSLVLEGMYVIKEWVTDERAREAEEGQ